MLLAISLLWAASRNLPSGERLPGVLRPWPLSIRIFMGCRGQLGIPGAKIVKCDAKETIGNDNCYYSERDLEDIGILK